MRRGSALSLALMVLLLATLLGSALLFSPSSTTVRMPAQIRHYQAQRLAEAAMDLEIFHQVWLQNDTVLPTGLVLDHPGQVYVSVDTSLFWLNVKADASVDKQTVHGLAILGRALDSAWYDPGIKILGSQAPADQASLRLDGRFEFAGEGDTIVSSQHIRSAIVKFGEQIWGPWNQKYHEMMSADSLEECKENCFEGRQIFRDVEDWEPGYPIRVRSGDLELDFELDESNRISHWPEIFVEGDVVIRGDYQLDTLSIYSKGKVSILGELRAKVVRVFAQAGLEIEGTHRFECQALVQQDVLVAGETKLLEGSVVIIHRAILDSLSEGRGDLIFTRGVEAQGWFLKTEADTSLKSLSIPGPPGIVVQDGARVRGVLISNGGVMNEGFIGGVVMAVQLSCWDTPEQNCGGRGAFVRDSLPSNLVQPIQLDIGSHGYLKSRKWRVF